MMGVMLLFSGFHAKRQKDGSVMMLACAFVKLRDVWPPKQWRTIKLIDTVKCPSISTLSASHPSSAVIPRPRGIICCVHVLGNSLRVKCGRSLISWAHIRKNKIPTRNPCLEDHGLAVDRCMEKGVLTAKLFVSSSLSQ